MDEVTRAANGNMGDVTTPSKLSENDSINHPAYYCRYRVEVIDLIDSMPFCRGAAIKYIARAGYKEPGPAQTQGEKELEDLRKARWMIDREIARMSLRN